MAVPATSPAVWNDILSTTMHNYRKTLTDNIFNSRPFLNYLMSNGRVKTVSGGISIVEPVMYTIGDTGTYSGYTPVDVAPVNTATSAQYDWKQMYATIAISGLEEAQNNGKEMIVNLLEAKIMQAEESLKDMLNKQLLGTWVDTATTAPGTDFGSIIDLVDDTFDAGGIDCSVETWWQSPVTDGTDVTGTAAGLESAMRAAFDGSSDSGSDRVDAIFTNNTDFGFYESTLTPQVRYTDVAKANLGFQNLMFRNCPIFWDFDFPANTMIGTNSKYVGLTLHSDRNFKQSPFTDNLSGSVSETGGSPTASALDARVSFITTYGNSTIRNRRRCFKIENLQQTT